MTEEERSKHMNDMATLEKDLCSFVGFRHIVDKIIEKQKIIVGHNMILDLLHFFEKFCACLPDNLFAFKEKAHTLFPL